MARVPKSWCFSQAKVAKFSSLTRSQLGLLKKWMIKTLTCASKFSITSKMQSVESSLVKLPKVVTLSESNLSRCCLTY